MDLTKDYPPEFKVHIRQHTLTLSPPEWTHLSCDREDSDVIKFYDTD